MHSHACVSSRMLQPFSVRSVSSLPRLRPPFPPCDFLPIRFVHVSPSPSHRTQCVSIFGRVDAHLSPSPSIRLRLGRVGVEGVASMPSFLSTRLNLRYSLSTVPFSKGIDRPLSHRDPTTTSLPPQKGGHTRDEKGWRPPTFVCPPPFSLLSSAPVRLVWKGGSHPGRTGWS